MQMSLIRLTMLAVLLSAVQFLSAQSALDQARAQVYRAYLNSDKAAWEGGVARLSQLYQQTGDLNTLYELALAEYGLVAYCVGSNACPDVDSRIARTEGYLETLLSRNSAHAPGNALLGALLAMKIGLSPAKSVYLGPRSSNYISKSVSLDGSHPAGWVEMGNMKYHAPAIFGGNMDEAISSFRKAVDLFDARPNLRRYNWLYLHACTWLGKAYESKGRYYEARDIYSKVLAYEPGFTWVKNELLPAAASRVR